MGALRHRGGACRRTLRKLRHDPLCRGKVSDEWISFVLDVEFEALGQEHCGASTGLGTSIGEPKGRLLAQESASSSAVGLARNPKSVFIPADEKQWNCFTKDFGIGSWRQFC